MNFSGSLSTASEGTAIAKFEWDFENDGVIDAQGENTSYTYTAKGQQTCRLVVTDSIGMTSEDALLVDVINRSPEADFTFAPNTPSIQDQVNMTDTSSDLDGTIVSWFWNFGDKTNSTVQNPSHTYTEKGEWQVALTVTDNDGAKSLTTKTITVRNLEPEASFECNTTEIQTDMGIQFTDKSIDPENKSLSWFWDFGDGNTSDLQAPTYKYNTQGDYNVTLTVKDDENAISTYTKTLSVVEAPSQDAVPLWIIAVIAVIIASVAFLGIFFWNRRQKSFSEMFTGSEDPIN